jgi:holo-[acyl-carrier protein] synthase
MIAHGIDLVDCKRIDAILKRHGDHFLARVYTPGEQESAGQGRNRIQRLAARFAAKEAVLKLIGTGLRGRMAFTDVEVVNDALGKPEVRVFGEVERRVQEMGIEQISISITHAADLAIASVVALTKAYEEE